MIPINVEKGIGLNMAGKPSSELIRKEKPSRVALLPERIPFVKPRLKVKCGEKVKIGSALFEDKRNPDIRFLSPGGGEVVEIDYGPRRVVRKIVVRLEGEEEFEDFSHLTEGAPLKTSREGLVEAMTLGGVWPFFRELPFRDIPSPDTVPPAVFVTLGAEEPFQPEPSVYLEGEGALFEFGIQILKKLTPNVHVVSAAAGSADLPQGLVTMAYKGNYPADDAGVHLYHTKKSPDENRAWFLDGQALLCLARFFKTGRYPVKRIVAVGGSSAGERVHVSTRQGVPVAHISRDASGEPDTRYIVGGVLRGYEVSREGFLGFGENALALLPSGDRPETFGFARPGYDKPTHSRAFLSVFNRSPLTFDCSVHGETRACVNCGYCAGVCPVEILPQFTMKAVVADEVEEALSHGLLDCVECGLCTYVCPSKIELARTLINAKASYYRESV